MSTHDSIGNPVPTPEPVAPATYPQDTGPLDGVWRCQDCGEMLDISTGKWRRQVRRWEHSHGQAGHIAASYFGPTPEPPGEAGEALEAVRLALQASFDDCPAGGGCNLCLDAQAALPVLREAAAELETFKRHTGQIADRLGAPPGMASGALRHKAGEVREALATLTAERDALAEEVKAARRETPATVAKEMRDDELHAEHLQTEVTALASRVAELEEKSGAFVARLDEVTPAIEAAFTFGHIHGNRYDGPDFKKELADLRALLSAAPEPAASPETAEDGA